jgi:hypothetical protein
MAMGREGDRQGDLIVTWAEIPRSPGHVFYDRLQEVLIAGGFDGFVERRASPITRQGWGHHRCRRGAISACTWSAILRGLPASEASPGAVRIRCRCVSSCGWRTGKRLPITRSLVVVEDPRAASP